eukprot:jgi/Hompol1/192/HPOL_005255-RA
MIGLIGSAVRSRSASLWTASVAATACSKSSGLQITRYASINRTCRAQFNTLHSLESRGLLNDATSKSALAHLLQSEATVVYAGFDPTAQSLHVGNLLTIIAMLHFQLAGHQAIALIGGATGCIGDPSGKSSERQQLDPKTLQSNIEAISAQLESLFANASAYAAKHRPATASQTSLKPIKILNNLDWFSKMSFLQFMSDVGRRARVSNMLARESVKSRLDSANGISFTEFTYQLLQAYDFWHLFSEHGCRIQLGGSDQWGNITAGTELIQKYVADKAVVKHPDAARAVQAVQRSGSIEHYAYGITIPLVTTASGEKFGKSAGNAVWLNEAMVSVFDFYQFFRRTPDSEVGRYLRFFTFLSNDVIAQLLSEHAIHPAKHLPQRALAFEVTELVHGGKS